MWRVVLPASVRMASHSSQEGGVHHLRRLMSFLILHRYLFAPTYTETHYTPSGNPRTTTLKSEVSSGQQIATKQLPSLVPPLGSEETTAGLDGDVPPLKRLFPLIEDQGSQQERPSVNLLFPTCDLSFDG